jgi:hypothetical protein
VRYVATSVGIEDSMDDDFMDVWLSERPDGTGRSLSFQRTLHEVEQNDVDMGMDSYCVSADSGTSVYGALLAVRRDGRVVTFSFVPEDAQLLRVDETVEVEIDVDDLMLETVMDGLRKVLLWGREASIPSLQGL